MYTVTATQPSPIIPWVSDPPPRYWSMSSTTPLGIPPRTPGSVGQALAPRIPTRSRTPHTSQDLRTASPSYFEFVADPATNPADSYAGGYARKNWSSAVTGLRQSAGVSPPGYPFDPTQRFEAFRRQSQNSNFRLSHGSLSHFSQLAETENSPATENLGADRSQETSGQSALGFSPIHTDSAAGQSRDKMDLAPGSEPLSVDENVTGGTNPSSFGLPRQVSPSNSPPLDLSKMQKDRAHQLEKGHRPSSLPHNMPLPLSPSPLQHSTHRADTLPSNLAHEEFKMISPRELADLMDSQIDMLLLDLRVYPQFSRSRINGAINLCIPTTLLKRPNFNVQRLSETFMKSGERAKFASWREAKAIIVYDAGSVHLRDATSSMNTLKKFTNEGWRGSAMVIKGGFSGFATSFPDRVDKKLSGEDDTPATGKLAIDPQVPVGAPVAGGCPMPIAQTAANPFFGNIRQNMDLIGGVGQIAVKLPLTLISGGTTRLPPWLRQVVDEKDNGKMVADRFFTIEQAEQKRMQKALSGNVSYGTPKSVSAGGFQIAGFEKGAKNRYKDMLPYDHSRVRLQNVPSGDCDYVNASHIKSERSHRHYVATQAPVPATFQDFWRVVWEQDARVIVMLTAETDGGQRKCHPYWLPGEYGQLQLKSISEKKVSLEAPKRPSATAFSPLSIQVPRAKRPTMDRRRSTNNSIPSAKDFPTPGALADLAVPDVVIRKLALSNRAHPSLPVREITQLQYSSWPDFGAPAHPAHVLSLVEYCGTIIRSYADSKEKNGEKPAAKGERPVMVHCSAGCGRTGTFCTVDSVIDILKKQRQRYMSRKAEFKKDDGSQDEGLSPMDIDDKESERDWFTRGEIDLVAQTVENFRLQRLSMVQTLRQFVLCYESVLEWLARAIRTEELGWEKGPYF